MELHTLIPGSIWYAQQPLQLGPFHLSSRMTVVRRADDSLWVVSPAQPEPGLLQQLRKHGDVRDVIAPNREHHFFLRRFLAEFPEARGWVAPGLAEKRPELSYLPPLDAAARRQWHPELHGVFIDGVPRLNETVWLHAPSRTLIVTDLLLCIGRDNPAPVRCAAGLVGALDRLAMGRHVRLCVRDRRALGRSIAEVLELDFDRLVLGHDQVIESGGHAAFTAAMKWLQRRS